MAEDQKSATPMLFPGDEKARLIPAARVAEAVLRGGVLAKRIVARDGSPYYVPIDSARMQTAEGKQKWIPPQYVEEAIQHGLHLVQDDGKEYPEGTAPRIVGHNQAGQPIWGTQDGQNVRGLVGSAWDAVKNAYLGLGQMMNPARNEYEKEHGLTTPYDYALYPLERFVEPNMQAAERAAQEFQTAREINDQPGARDNFSLTPSEEHRALGAGEAIASTIPGFGPWAASLAEQAAGQMATGDPAGAEGTVLGNLAVAAAPELVKGAASVAAKSLPNRLAERQAPAADLDREIAPEDLTYRQRYAAAKRMGVNLDRAQATGASIPGMVKRVTEHSLGGREAYDENLKQNVDALGREADRIVNTAGGGQPMISREQFGNQVKAKLQAHRASLTDEPGQRADAQALLDSASPDRMTREQFGDAVKNAMERHRGSIDEQERSLYEGLDNRLGERGPDMSAVRKKAQAIYNQNKRFYENHPEALSGADARVWKWVKDLAGEGKEEKTVSTQGAPKPTDTWADLQRARSHLLDLTRGPEFVGDLATGWAKQLTGAIDETMTSAEHTPGLSKRDVQDFRQANQLHKELKETYDNPQNPFYWISREGGIRAADRLNSLQPREVQWFNDAMRAGDRKDLVGQFKRQTIGRLMDPAGNGEFDLAGLASRWSKVPKEQATGILGPGYRSALDDIADRARQNTVYDAAGSRLAQIINATDGLKANDVMFNKNGSLRLTPEDVRTIQQADPSLVPILRQHAISRLFNPAGGDPDLTTFGNQWKKAQGEMYQGLLTPQHIQDLDELASVSRAVNAKSNPSGTAVSTQPVNEARGVTAGLSSGGTLALTGHPVAGAAAAALPAIYVAADRAVGSRMVNPEATDAIMNHPTPVAVSTAVKDAAANARPDVSVPIAGAAAAQPPLNERDKFKQMTDARAATVPSQATTPGGSLTPTTADKFRQMTDQRRGISTPPNGGQVTSETQAEPNEVHDEAAAQRVMAAQQPSAASSLAPTPVPQPGGVEKLSTPEGQTIYQAPEGATHEVLHPDDHSLLGHVVNGEYVPLQQ